MKKQNKIMKTMVSVVVSSSMVLGSMPMAFAQKLQQEQPKGHVTMSVEKFTLGLGYVKEPIEVPFYEGDNVAYLVTKIIGEGNYKNTGNVDSSFYLSRIKDNDTREPNVPQYILDKCGDITKRSTENWLGEFDYTPMSGWMYCINSEFPNVGASGYTPKDGDVIRWQFTTYGYGADIGGDGFGSSEPFISVANKDKLTALVGKVNSQENKAELLANSDVKVAYDEAYKVLEDVAVSQGNLNNALEDLELALDTPNVELQSINLDKDKMTIEEGKKESLKVKYNPENTTESKTVAWISSDEKIAKVDKNGEVTGVKEGTATITAKVGDKTATCIVTISPKQASENKIDVKSAINETAAYQYKNNQNPQLYSEWDILGLARSGYNIPSSYYDTYYNNIVNKVKEVNGVLSDSKYTEYSRVILALNAIGKDATNVGGYDLVKNLYDFDKVVSQGINGAIFALIALDSKQGINTNSLKGDYVDYILDSEIQNGGWALWGDKADPDITAMALQALAKYQDDSDVKSCIDRAVDALSKMQNKNGGYESWGSLNSESVSQVIVALTALGINPATDSRFIKEDGKSALSALMEFYVEGGGFRHTMNTDVNGMGTEQGMYALVAYDRLINNQKPLYDMTDAVK
ncbi:DUF4430 domain-containing protein [Romboutsia maritimum]|uniref:DUF4430 domain-containing protein n=1 Tax=Romboutsia maritimum TaxID=2020948 RepID=A0A371IPQ8_9FIRM|nr:Ig-like domain-containing protein [Romboutsia maritimum]RDY22465.1 DUF4430 domain-containing protein [Romboutsia maritimum]